MLGVVFNPPAGLCDVIFYDRYDQEHSNGLRGQGYCLYDQNCNVKGALCVSLLQTDHHIPPLLCCFISLGLYPSMRQRKSDAIVRHVVVYTLRAKLQRKNEILRIMCFKSKIAT